jgi:2-polyprenyl-3-methyl-5-hydroxy-6-metoxy-1,4-benzoquinol methylase
MIQFIHTNDHLGNQINQACNELYKKITTLDVDTLPLEPFYKWYFKKCHLSRPIFSLQTSAKMLYDGIMLTKKEVKDIVVMDYGAGLGTLYIIAKMIGAKTVIYNDLMPEFAQPAIKLDKIFGIVMDHYITGDTQETCTQLVAKNLQCDLIVSRNVVEHIYSLQDFFAIMQQYQPKAILYNSTTANWRNPAAHIQHVLIHKRSRKLLAAKKLNILKASLPEATDTELKILNNILLQYGGKEFTDAIANFKHNKIMPSPKNDYTNVCDETGNWGEHLLPYKKYEAYAPQYLVHFKPGFWDVNYSSVLKSTLGKTLNFFTKILGDNGVVLSSFFYVVAVPKKA